MLRQQGGEHQIAEEGQQRQHAQAPGHPAGELVAGRQQLAHRRPGRERPVDDDQRQHVDRQPVEQHVHEGHRPDGVGQRIDEDRGGGAGQQLRQIVHRRRQQRRADADGGVGGRRVRGQAQPVGTAQQRADGEGDGHQHGEPQPQGGRQVGEPGVQLHELRRGCADHGRAVPVVDQQGRQARAACEQARGHHRLEPFGDALRQLFAAQVQHPAFGEAAFLFGDGLLHLLALVRDVRRLALGGLAQRGEIGPQLGKRVVGPGDAVRHRCASAADLVRPGLELILAGGLVPGDPALDVGQGLGIGFQSGLCGRLLGRLGGVAGQGERGEQGQQHEGEAPRGGAEGAGGGRSWEHGGGRLPGSRRYAIIGPAAGRHKDGRRDRLHGTRPAIGQGGGGKPCRTRLACGMIRRV
ncbi:MAG: hypothetical protein LOY58_14995 [Gammaproteobacteria bacterium]|nr:hypothetical protein [Gammaproteobacteria bacterium]